jgi:hypothetical protein
MKEKFQGLGEKTKEMEHSGKRKNNKDKKK